jgi:hypothetical protein
MREEIAVSIESIPFRKGMSALFKGDEHAAGLKDKRAQLEKLQDRIDRFAMVGLHERVGDMHEREYICFACSSSRRAAKVAYVESQRSDIVLNRLNDFVKDGQAQLIRAYEDSQIQKARAEAYEAKLRRMMELLDLRKGW